MLSKTNVHHFAGNNVSHSTPLWSVGTIGISGPNDQPPGGRGALPNEEAPSWDFGGCRACADDGNLQIELGTACGKLYRCSTMAVLDAGDSDILTGATS